MSKQESSNDKVIENRRARFDYAIEDTLEVGIALQGSEVKSVRDGHVSLNEGFVKASSDPCQLMLLNVEIGEYAPSAAYGHKPKRSRVLLAHRGEILRLAKKMQVKGYTIVPLKLYFKNGFAKLLIGVGKGKTKHDKRQSIAKREAKRDIDRATSRRL